MSTGNSLLVFWNREFGYKLRCFFNFEISFVKETSVHVQPDLTARLTVAASLQQNAGQSTQLAAIASAAGNRGKRE